MNHALAAVFAIPLLLAGCVETDVDPQIPIDPTPIDSCGAVPYGNLVGQPAVVLDGLRFSQEVRVIRPGMAVTEDYRASRLNFWLVEGIVDGDIIDRVTCG
jgi:Peptidase inhibitor I78 family